mgnify:CR=1 FL=1
MPSLKKLHTDAASKLGLHSKLTGAGGGGCVYTLLPLQGGDNVILSLRKVVEEELGMEVCFVSQLGGEGVSVKMS